MWFNTVKNSHTLSVKNFGTSSKMHRSEMLSSWQLRCTSTCNYENILILCTLRHNFCIPRNSTSCTKTCRIKSTWRWIIVAFSEVIQTLCISKVILCKADDNVRTTVLWVSSNSQDLRPEPTCKIAEIANVTYCLAANSDNQIRA